MTEKPEIRLRDEHLKRKWAGTNDKVTINGQYVFETRTRENDFIAAQFPTEEERTRYQWYREEWYRRGKTFDPGDIPLSVTCELVSTCNLACNMCYTVTDKFQNSVIGSQRMLPWPIVRSIIDEAAELGIPSILFSWRGESSLYRGYDEDGNLIRFYDVLAYARKKKIIEISSLTHGQLIDEEMAQGIVAAEPSWISFSIDGLEEAYNTIRTPPDKKGKDYNAFKVVIENIQRIVAIRNAQGKKRPQIRINTIFPAIADDPNAYRKFMEGIGVDLVTINEIFDYRWHKVPEEEVMKDWACSFPFQRLAISANGIILPCTGATNEEKSLVLGRYKGSVPKEVRDFAGKVVPIEVPEMTIREVWHSKKIDGIRKAHINGSRCKMDPGCRNCHHGMVKRGADWIPDEWKPERMEWGNHKGRVKY